VALFSLSCDKVRNLKVLGPEVETDSGPGSETRIFHSTLLQTEDNRAILNVEMPTINKVLNIGN
jgi:hypothetical protein